MGPFVVTAEQIVRLAGRFTEFVNRLLETEIAAVGLAGYRLEITRLENTPDGGVDAALRSSQSTDWLPPDSSAWQFKRSNLGPQEVADEIRGARWAQEFIREGGSYVLVLGASLNDQLIEERRRRLVETAVALGLLLRDDPERIRVYDANKIARWASRYPSIAIGPLIGGPGGGVVDFERWSSSRHHQHSWIDTEDRDQAIETIRAAVSTSRQGEIHVDGPAGIGKTRLAMEALRLDELRPLVAYVANEEGVSDELLGYVLSEERSVILVVDECAGRQHDKLAERLPASPALRLVTIGEPDTHSLIAPVYHVGQLKESDIDSFLRQNFPQLSQEARRLVSGQSTGNVRFAIVLAQRLLDLGPTQAADLIGRNDIEEITRTLMPEGRPFFLATLVALFERVGWDGDISNEMEQIAQYAGVTTDELRDVGREMERRGTMVRQGRYRAIQPNPLAVVLAADAWRESGTRIVEELLPKLDREMVLSLFARVADLGRYEPARRVLASLLGPGGLFGTLGSLEEHDLGRLLTHLAVVAPEETTDYLVSRIGDGSLDQLRRYTKSRRDLVWTLEKLAWHRNTFERAADCLLRLALAENESYGNNATGTWIALFGVVLPATAALPNERIAYLMERSRSPSRDVRWQVTRACAESLHPYESVGVSGELQGGAYVDPRGGVRTHDEMVDYRSALLDILADLTFDVDSDVAKSSSDALIGAVLPLVDVPVLSEKLISILSRFAGSTRDQLFQEIERLRGLIQRSESPALAAGLDNLVSALPKRAPIDELRVLLRLQTWDLQEGELRSRFDAAVDEVVKAGRAEDVLQWLTEAPLVGGWFLGYQLATHTELGDLRPRLVEAIDTNLPALAGYLSGRADSGEENAFDSFLDSESATGFARTHALALTVRGPVSARAKDRLFGLLPHLSVEEGAYGLFGWQGSFDDADFLRLMNDWTPRVHTQQAYNALVDWIVLWLHPDRSIPPAARQQVLKLLKRRMEFRELANARWDWSELAKRFVETNPLDLALVLLDLVDAGDLIGLGHHDEGHVLADAARHAPYDIWAEVGRRLEAQDWRISMSLSGWFIASVPVAVIFEWIGDSIERAQLVASITDPGDSEPTDIAKHLLERFGDDPDIRSDLAMEFLSSSWTGPASAHLEEQIRQLEGWLETDEPPKVKNWAREVISYLQTERNRALERESEERW